MIGFPPIYRKKYIIENYTTEQLAVLVEESLDRLKWKTDFSSLNLFEGSITTNDRLYNYVIHLSPETIHFESRSDEGFYDQGMNRKNSEEFISFFKKVKSDFQKEDLDFRYEIIARTFKKTEQEETIVEEKKNFNFFLPQKNYLVTPILLYTNVLIFVAMGLSGMNLLMPDGKEMIHWQSNFGPLTLNGEWWRIITCCFLHFGFIHLFFNMYALTQIGAIVEQLTGSIKFLAAYILAGISGSILSLFVHNDVNSAGASGAIFGMFGMFLSLLTTNLLKKEVRKPALMNMAVLIIFNLTFGMIGNIDNAGHIGGLIAGFIMGYVYYPFIRERRNYWQIAIAAAILLIGILDFILWKNIPPIRKIDKSILVENKTQTLKHHSN